MYLYLPERQLLFNISQEKTIAIIAPISFTISIIILVISYLKVFIVPSLRKGFLKANEDASYGASGQYSDSHLKFG